MWKYVTYPAKKINIKKDFEKCEWYIFEICSVKIYTKNGYQVHQELGLDYTENIHIQTEEDLLSDLKIIKDMIPKNKKILFQVHFRPNIIFNDDNKKILNREQIYKCVNYFCQNNENCFIYDPSIILKKIRIY